MLTKAIIIAAKTHAGQTDKAGEPYILHPLRVMLIGDNELERLCGVIHNVIEDKDITFKTACKVKLAELNDNMDLYLGIQAGGVGDECRPTGRIFGAP